MAPRGPNFNLEAVGISGFKSFQDFKLQMSRLTVLIGSNGAGKSNFLEALDLITSVHRIGLDEAVDAFGGFDAIARRTSAGAVKEVWLSISATVELTGIPPYVVRHQFAIGSSDRLGRFSVESERLAIAQPPERLPYLSIQRTKTGLLVISPSKADLVTNRLLSEIVELTNDLTSRNRVIDRSKLFLPTLAPFSVLINAFTDALSSTRTFEIDAESAREESDKSHRPDLTPYGGDLPSFLEWLQEDHPESFGRVESGLRDMLPSLASLNISETQPGVRAVQFIMEDGPSPLYPSFLSDGTIKYLALLAALNDPRSSLLLLEEPENSLHPWLINRLCESISTASRAKSIVLTSHSPQIMQSLPGDSLYVVWNSDSRTHAAALKSLAPELVEAWSKGEISVFDIVDSGAITQYLPNYGQ